MDIDEQKSDQGAPTPALNSSSPAPSDGGQDYREAAKSMATYAQQYPPKPAKGKGRSWMWPLVVVAIIIILAAGYWFFIRTKQATPVASNTSKNQTSQTSNASQSAALIDPTTKTYSSNNFNLSFAYPADWTVSDPGGTSMTVISPQLQLKDSAGQSVNGKIILTIAQKGQNLGAFSKGDATAVLDSQKVSYTNPTQNQRANTYISFLQYASTSATGALDSVDITGDYGYDKGQSIPKIDISNIDPLITLTFAKCASGSCSSTSALSIASTQWTNSAFANPLTNLLKSLAIN